MARPRACPSHTGRHPGAPAGVSRPCGEHRMRADCRAHAPTLAVAPSPALQSIGHPYRDLRPGQVRQRASGPACHADRGARLHGATHPGQRRRNRPALPVRIRHAALSRSRMSPARNAQPAAEPGCIALPCCGDRLSGRNLERVQPHPQEYSGGLRRLPRCGRRTRTVGRRGKPAARDGPGAGRRRRRGRESRPADDLICSVRAVPLLPGRPGARHGPCLAQGHAAARPRDAGRRPASHRTGPESCPRPRGQRRGRRRPDPYPARTTRRPASTAVTGRFCEREVQPSAGAVSAWVGAHRRAEAHLVWSGAVHCDDEYAGRRMPRCSPRWILPVFGGLEVVNACPYPAS